MNYNYQIVLFKNKEKKKIINQFVTHKKANDFYKKLISESELVIFPRHYENGVVSFFELALVEKISGTMLSMFLKDDLGRQVKVSLDDNDRQIIKISNYNIEEEFLDYQTKNKINSNQFISKYLNKDGLKMLSKLNNKIVLQNDDTYELFTFKNDFESERFIDSISDLFIKQKRTDCLLVKDNSIYQRKFLYEQLVEKGFSKDYLQRHSTTHPSKK